MYLDIITSILFSKTSQMNSFFDEETGNFIPKTNLNCSIDDIERKIIDFIFLSFGVVNSVKVRKFLRKKKLMNLKVNI